jgi:hypothetical protein
VSGASHITNVVQTLGLADPSDRSEKQVGPFGYIHCSLPMLTLLQGGRNGDRTKSTASWASVGRSRLYWKRHGCATGGSTWDHNFAKKQDKKIPSLMELQHEPLSL